MAHHVEPMDIDSDFDNKENSLHHNNVLPFTEKGYEELDVSELNMKLRYSVTPASSPMSKSYTAHCPDRSLDSGDGSLNVTINENVNMSHSLNSTMTKNDNIVKSLKALPLQSISTEQFVDSNRNTSVLRPLDPITTPDNCNITVTVRGTSDMDENLSLPSSSSSAPPTPEATTPTKDIHIKDGGSPIMRGLKSVLNMFRSSQSPIPLHDNDNIVKSELSPVEEPVSTPETNTQLVLASTPISSHRKKEMSPTKRNSPSKDSSIVFNDDLEKELQWKDETTIIFSQERIPIHKLLLQQPQDNKKMTYKEVTDLPKEEIKDLNSTVEYMDISYNDSIIDKTITDIEVDNKRSDNTFTNESDNEFVDCETTFTQNMSQIIDDNDKTPVANQIQDLDLAKSSQNNDSGSRLKPIILDTTQDILDATLSVRPEDLFPEGFDRTKDYSAVTFNKTHDTLIEKEIEEQLSSLKENQIIFDETVNITNPLTLKSKAEGLHATKGIENMSTSQPINQTFDVTNSTINIENQNENLDGTVTIKNVLSLTLPLENQENIVGNLNTTNTTAISAEIPVATVLHQPALEDTANESIPSDNIKEVSMTVLPVDIPLPDDDDLEKEQNISIDTTPDVTPPISLPIDLADDIKIMAKSNTIEEYKQDMTENLGTIKNIVLESDSLKSLPVCDDNIINETNLSEDVQEIRENHKHLNIEEEKSGNIDETDNIVVPSNVIDNKIFGDSKINDKNNTLNATDTEDANVIVENTGEPHNKLIQNVTQNQKVVSMDINESVCEFKPLPDIINQMITLPNTECIGVIINESVSDKTDQVDSTQPVIPVVANSGINEIEQKVTSTNDLECMEHAIDKKLSLIASVDTTETDKIHAALNHSKPTIVDNSPSDLEGINQVTDNSKVRELEDEIVLSENNSPFVSVIAENIPEVEPQKVTIIENFEDPCVTKNKVVITPPSSPPITSKGYNFNFDDIDFDPFTTKTKIRLSPPSDSPSKLAESEQVRNIDKPVPKKDFNRRRSQPERKKPTVNKRKLNSTFHGKISDKITEKPFDKNELEGNVQLASPATIALKQNNVTIEENKLNEPIVIPPKSVTEQNEPNEILNTEIEIVRDDKVQESIETSEGSEAVLESNLHDLKAASSSEQSTYYSACTSASEISLPSKNVFNLPEIDDMNFNPFATKSKMRQSPPPNLDLDDPFATKSKIISSPDSSMIMTENKEITSFDDNVATEPMKDNLSNLTVDIKVTDEVNTSGSTVNVHTEDEDTVEGPFLESEELNHDDKLSDFDSENDMMQFNELPIQSNEDNLDTGEMFIDAEAFEFLLNQNKSNIVSDSGKESLFLKFDPLFAKRMSAVTSDGVVASLAQLQKRQSTPTKTAITPPKNMPLPVAGSSSFNVTGGMDMSEEFNDDLNITVSKPMMVVPPAVNPVTPRNKSLTPNRSNRRSITFTSPAMAVIDRLLSLSGNNSQVHDTTVTQVSREQNEADIALSQLRELLAEKEINVYTLRSESNDLRDRLSTLEGHVKNLESENEDRLKKINQLNNTLVEKTKTNKSMAAVVEEYERTIASLIAEIAQDKKRHAEERIQLMNERDEQTAHLASMEVSFSDLHSKYEKSKQIILNCKANEETYKKSIKEFEVNLGKMQNNYELLKQHATSKLNHANQELEKINRSHEAEVLKLNAMIKRKELHITSLEESLTQKTKANEELTAICDELINKVG